MKIYGLDVKLKSQDPLKNEVYLLEVRWSAKIGLKATGLTLAQIKAVITDPDEILEALPGMPGYAEQERNYYREVGQVISGQSIGKQLVVDYHFVVTRYDSTYDSATRSYKKYNHIVSAYVKSFIGRNPKYVKTIYKKP